MDGTCVIFGGTGAIGGAIAQRLANQSRDVVVVSRHLPPKTPSLVRHVVADVTVEESVREAVHSVSKAGPLGAVVYAVGLRPDVSVGLSQYATTDWRRTFATYLDGFFYVYKATLPLLQPGGHMVAISSAITRFNSASLPPLNAGHYAAAKASLDEFCKWARREAHLREVLLSRLAPGSVLTPAREALNLPPGDALPVALVAEKVVDAIVTHREMDEQMLATPGEGGQI